MFHAAYVSSSPQLLQVRPVSKSKLMGINVAVFFPDQMPYLFQANTVEALRDFLTW